jgi:hypothetical protein
MLFVDPNPGEKILRALVKAKAPYATSPVPALGTCWLT